MMGPLLGGLLYNYMGLAGAFLVFAAILLAAGMMSLTMLPNSFNVKLGV
jgi:hypothetical protein